MPKNFPEAPKTSVELIEKSRHKEEIFTKLLSGWSPARIVYWLYNRYGKTGITITEVLQFAREIPEELWLDTSQLDAKFHGVDIEVDWLTETHRLLRFAKSRLDDVLVLEHAGETVQQDSVERRARMYWDMLIEFGKLAAVAGLLIPEAAITPNAPEERPRTLKDVITRRRRIIAEQTEYALPEEEAVGELQEPAEAVEGSCVEVPAGVEVSA